MSFQCGCDKSWKGQIAWFSDTPGVPYSSWRISKKEKGIKRNRGCWRRLLKKTAKQNRWRKLLQIAQKGSEKKTGKQRCQKRRLGFFNCFFPIRTNSSFERLPSLFHFYTYKIVPIVPTLQQTTSAKQYIYIYICLKRVHESWKQEKGYRKKCNKKIAKTKLMRKISNIYCVFGPTLAASARFMCVSTQTSKKHAEQPRSFWKWGNCCDTSPGCAFRLWIWLVEMWHWRINESTSNYLVCVIGNNNGLGHMSWRGHLPTVETHLCCFKGGRRENEWVGKEKQSLQRGGNKRQHPKGCNLLKAYVTWQCMLLVLLCHLTSCSRKNTWDKLLKNWQLLLFEYKNSLLPPLANNSLSCSWNNSYCAFGPTLAASAKLMRISTQTSKKHAGQQHSFWKWGNGCDTSRSRAFSPV